MAYNAISDKVVGACNVHRVLHVQDYIALNLAKQLSLITLESNYTVSFSRGTYCPFFSLCFMVLQSIVKRKEVNCMWLCTACIVH